MRQLEQELDTLDQGVQERKDKMTIEYSDLQVGKRYTVFPNSSWSEPVDGLTYVGLATNPRGGAVFNVFAQRRDDSTILSLSVPFGEATVLDDMVINYHPTVSGIIHIEDHPEHGEDYQKLSRVLEGIVKRW